MKNRSSRPALKSVFGVNRGRTDRFINLVSTEPPIPNQLRVFEIRYIKLSNAKIRVLCAFVVVSVLDLACGHFGLWNCFRRSQICIRSDHGKWYQFVSRIQIKERTPTFDGWTVSRYIETRSYSSRAQNHAKSAVHLDACMWETAFAIWGSAYLHAILR